MAASDVDISSEPPNSGVHKRFWHEGGLRKTDEQLILLREKDNEEKLSEFLAGRKECNERNAKRMYFHENWSYM